MSCATSSVDVECVLDAVRMHALSRAVGPLGLCTQGLLHELEIRWAGHVLLRTWLWDVFAL